MVTNTGLAIHENLLHVASYAVLVFIFLSFFLLLVYNIIVNSVFIY